MDGSWISTTYYTKLHKLISQSLDKKYQFKSCEYKMMKNSFDNLHSSRNEQENPCNSLQYVSAKNKTAQM